MRPFCQPYDHRLRLVPLQLVITAPVGQTVELLVLDDDDYALGQTAGVRDAVASRALPGLIVSAARVFAD